MTEFDNIDNETPKFIFRKERDFGEVISDTFGVNFKNMLSVSAETGTCAKKKELPMYI